MDPGGNETVKIKCAVRKGNLAGIGCVRISRL